MRTYLSSFVSFIETLNPQQQRQLCKVATVQELPEEHVICETGDPGDVFYIILRGRLSMWHGHAPKHGEAWDEYARIKHGLATGESFGELALQDDHGVRSVTVRTEEPTVLAVLSKRNYLLTVQNVFEQATRDRVDFMCRMPALQLEPLMRLRTLVRGGGHTVVPHRAMSYAAFASERACCTPSALVCLLLCLPKALHCLCCFPNQMDAFAYTR